LINNNKQSDSYTKLLNSYTPLYCGLAGGARGCTDRCAPGRYFVVERRQCVDCPRGRYQPQSGQDFCVQCPANTTTDHTAAVSPTQCKSTRASYSTDFIQYTIARSDVLSRGVDPDKKYGGQQDESNFGRLRCFYLSFYSFSSPTFCPTFFKTRSLSLRAGVSRVL